MDAALATQDAFGRPLEHRPDWAAVGEEEGPPGVEELGRAGWTARVDEQRAVVRRAEEPGAVTTWRSLGHAHVVRIALTGGPCAGKSGALDSLVARANDEGFDVYIVPYKVTGAQIADFGLSREYNKSFYKRVLEIQLSVERGFVKVAEATGRPCILVCHRGMMDCKSTATATAWAEALAEMGQAHPELADFGEAWMLGAREQQIGGSGGSLEPPGPLLEPPCVGLFLRTSMPCIWRILSAFLPT